MPALCRLIEHGARQPGIELDAVAQRKAVGHMVGVAQQFGLGRVALGPAPLLLQCFRKPKRIFHALDVHPRTRIPVVVPGAADARSGFYYLGLQAHTARLVQHVKTGKTRAHNEHVNWNSRLAGNHMLYLL